MYATRDLAVPLDCTLGVELIATLISAVLYGVMLMQAFHYFTLYSKDIFHLKVLIVVLVVLESAHLPFITHIVYYHLITTYYDEAKLQYLTRSVPMQVLCTNLISNLVQSYYAIRVWKLGKSKLLLLFIFLLILTQCSCGLAWVLITLRMTTYAQVVTVAPLTMTIHALSALIDVVLSFALVALLYRSLTGLDKSDSLISRMIHFAASTGLLTSFCAIAALVGIAVSPTKRIYVVFYFCLGRLYTNSLLAALNSRRMLTRLEAPNRSTSLQFTSVQSNHRVTTLDMYP